MLIAVLIPQTVRLDVALQTRGAQQAIALGFQLYAKGDELALLREPRDGWERVRTTKLSREVSPCAS